MFIFIACALEPSQPLLVVTKIRKSPESYQTYTGILSLLDRQNELKKARISSDVIG